MPLRDQLRRRLGLSRLKRLLLRLDDRLLGILAAFVCLGHAEAQAQPFVQEPVSFCYRPATAYLHVVAGQCPPGDQTLTADEFNRQSRILKSAVPVEREELKRVLRDYTRPVTAEVLSPAEYDVMLAQLYDCWTPPLVRTPAEIEIRLFVNLDRTVELFEVVNADRGRREYRDLLQSVRDAIRHPDCRKLKLPIDKPSWKTVTAILSVRP